MINLLPLSEREKIYSDLLQKQINSFGLFIALVFFGSAVFILNTFVFLKTQTSELKQNLNVEEIRSETKEVKILEKEIKDLNAMLGDYREFKTERKPVLNVFLKIKEIVPAGVNLNTFLFDVVAGKIILSGVADSREDVVFMENKLKKSDFFENVESPLSNFLGKSDSKFSFTFYIKKK